MAHGSLDREHESRGRSQPCPGAAMADSPAAPRPPGPGLPADGDDAAAPMETGAQPGTPPCLPPSHSPAEEDDFQFILCEGCRQESPNLKLLTCLHTLCLGCLSENKPIGKCPVCSTAIPQASGIPDMDNLLFINLQARLKVYKELSSSSGPSCRRCQVKTAVVWCSECEEFLCTKCFEDHQWFFKKKSHKAKRVEELRAESAHQFLEDNRKSCSLFCSTSGHAEQGHVSSIYCRQCEKALCCSCALLDSGHTAFCDIRSETQRRQQELGTVTRGLREQRGGFEATCAALREEAARLEREQRELRELIRQRVEQLVRLLRSEEEELLGMLEARQEQGRRELARELQRVEGVLRSMEAGERLVEKMSLYATEQEVMDMQPFIKGALQDLQQAAVRSQAQPVGFAECRARLQALVERIEGHPGTSAPHHDSLSEDGTTLIGHQEPHREHYQLHGGLPMGLHAPHQPCAPVSDPSSSRGHVCPRQGGDVSLTQPTSPALPMQRDEKAEKDAGSAHGNTVPLPRSIQDSLALLQEDFGGWARSNRQQAEKLLKMGNRLLQAQHRANRHLVSMTQEIRAMSHSLANIASAVGPLLQATGNSQEPQPAHMEWPSLPSSMLELLLPSTLQRQEPPFPVSAAAPSHVSSHPATPLVSPACSEPPSPASEEEHPKSRHPTSSKRGGKPSTRLRKRRKK